MLLSALGLCLRVDLDESLSAEEIARLEEQWGDSKSKVTAPDGVLHAGMHREGVPRRDVTGVSIDDLASNLTVRVTLKALEMQQGELLMLHSCGVALGDGRVVAFVGPSGRGKTTAARTLGKHFAYVSDETIGVGPNGEVHPYRKPLSIIVEAGKTKQQVSPTSLELLPLPAAPLKLAAIVLLERELDGPQVPVVEEVGLVEGIPALLPETSYLAAMDSPLEWLARAADATGGILRVRYRDADSLTEIVEELASHRGEPSPWVTRRAVPKSAQFAGKLCAREDVDAMEVDGSLFVFANGTLHVLQGIGPLIWGLANGENSDQEIVDLLSAELGSPPEGDARELVALAIGELLAVSLLTRAA